MLNKATLELKNQIGQEKLIDKLDVSKLHYLQCIISKTFQLYPVAHLSSYDCTIRGYDIPLDTILLVNAWTIQRDSKMWDDITSFKPKTFEMGEDGPHKLLMPFRLRRRAYSRAGLVQHTVNLTLVLLI